MIFTSFSPGIPLVQLSKPTLDLLKSLDALSGYTLARRSDLGTLLELSTLNGQQDILDELGFQSKFISKTFGIMTRIGKDANGYERLEREFTEAAERAKVLMRKLLESAPTLTRHGFSITYLSMTSESLQNLLGLCYDLSWYKNWLIDNSSRHRQ